VKDIKEIEKELRAYLERVGFKHYANKNNQIVEHIYVARFGLHGYDEDDCVVYIDFINVGNRYVYIDIVSIPTYSYINDIAIINKIPELRDFIEMCAKNKIKVTYNFKDVIILEKDNGS